MSNPQHRHPKNDYLQHLIDYFRRVSDLWEGPDGCGTMGTTQCEHIIIHLKILQSARMALGLTHLPPVDGYAPAIPVFGVSVPSDEVQAFATGEALATIGAEVEDDIYDAVGKFREAHPEKVDHPTNLLELKMYIDAATIRNQIEHRRQILSLIDELAAHNAEPVIVMLDEPSEHKHTTS
jgi:hypothetical protein